METSPPSAWKKERGEGGGPCEHIISFWNSFRGHRRSNGPTALKLPDKIFDDFIFVFKSDKLLQFQLGKKGEGDHQLEQKYIPVCGEKSAQSKKEKKAFYGMYILTRTKIDPYYCHSTSFHF